MKPVHSVASAFNFGQRNADVERKPIRQEKPYHFPDRLAPCRSTASPTRQDAERSGATIYCVSVQAETIILNRP